MTAAPREPEDRSDRPQDREVEAWLRDAASAGAAPSPREGFAAEARGAFVGGELAPRDATSASLAGRDARRAAAMIEDRLHAQPPPPPARAAFRDDLRARFVAGELIERAAPPPLRRREGGRAPGRGPALRLVVGTLAAAAALWLVARLILPDEPAWRGFRADGPGPVVVDGAELLPRDLSELGGAFRNERTIETRERRLELVHTGGLAVALLPGARVTVRSDGSNGEVRLALDAGEIYLKTHEGYTGPAVIIETADMDMRMTGTVVGVMKEPHLSCICIERGSVEVDPRGGASKVCLADTSNVVDAEHKKLAGCPSEEVMAMNPAHILGLRDFALAAW